MFCLREQLGQVELGHGVLSLLQSPGWVQSEQKLEEEEEERVCPSPSHQGEFPPPEAITPLPFDLLLLFRLAAQ